MKLAQPKLSANLKDATIEQMVDDGELEAVRLSGEIAINCNVVDLQLIDVLIEDIHLSGSHLSRILARDVVFRRSELSSASMDNGMLVRVEFINCRMSDVDFSYTNIHDVIFRDCKLDRANFTKTDLRRVKFIGCSFEAVDFSTTTCNDVER